jgi:L-alanine-DL-glutamate epimerase-like enolase superfamily enzyme
MKVTGARAVLLSHYWGPGTELVWVGGRVESWDVALIELSVDGELTGLGEVAQGIMAAAAVPGVLDALRTYLIGLDFSSPPELSRRLRDRTAFWSRGGLCSGVIGAVELAAWDIAGKQAGRPAYQLMGERGPGSLELYASGGLGRTFDQVSSWVAAQEDAGFGTVKFRAMSDPATTVALLDHVVPRLRGSRFVLDAVQGCASHPWSTDDAIRVGREVAARGGRWYEEPCRAEDVAGYVAVRRSAGIAISGVESYATVEEFGRLIEAGGVDLVQPDAGMLPGPSALQEVAARALKAGLGCVPHAWGSGVGLMGNLHTAFATEGIDLFEWCTLPNPLREALITEPPRFEDGRVLPPTAPGLGVALSPELERHYPFRPGHGHVIT